MQEIEQAEQGIENNQTDAQVAPVAEDSGFSGIFREALKGEVQAPRPEQPGANANSPTQQAEKLFAELVIDENNRIPFKTKEDYDKFIESNEILKGERMRLSDYTRKTQEIANFKKQLEEEAEGFRGMWGEVQPNEASLQGIQALWQAYQKGDPAFQTALNRLVEDSTAILSGQQPKHLSGLVSAKDPNFSVAATPEVQELREVTSQLKSEFEQIRYDKAKNEWESWKGGKEKNGIQFTDELPGMMSHFLGVIDPKTGKPMTLDRAYDYSVRELGLENVDAVKKVFVESKDKARKSPSAPNSHISSAVRPQPKGFADILRQGLEDLQ